MTRAIIRAGEAALLAACLAGCSESSEGPRSPAFARLIISSIPSPIYVGSSFQIVATPVTSQIVAITGTPSATFASSDPSKVMVDAKSGVATAVDTGVATITATLDFGSTHSASILIYVVPIAAPIPPPPLATADLYATDSLTFDPGTLTVQGDGYQRANVTIHFGHVTHSLRLYRDYSRVPWDLGPHAETSVTLHLRESHHYSYYCLIHPSMHGEIIVR